MCYQQFSLCPVWLKSMWLKQVASMEEFKYVKCSAPFKSFSNSWMQRKGHPTMDPKSKRAPHNGPQKWMRPRGVWPWGIQIGPFAVNKTYFCKVDFHFINNHMQEFPFPACTLTHPCTKKKPIYFKVLSALILGSRCALVSSTVNDCPSCPPFVFLYMGVPILIPVTICYIMESILITLEYHIHLLKPRSWLH